MTTCFKVINTNRRTVFYSKTDVEDYADRCKLLVLNRDEDLARYLPVVRQVCLYQWGRVPKHVEPLRAGSFHILYRIDFVPGGVYVMRLNRLPELRVALEFELEGWAYAQLVLQGLQVPTVVATDCSRVVCLTDYQIMTYVPGRPLTMFENSETQAMNPVLLHAVGEYVARFHAIKLSGYGPLSIALTATGIHKRWSDYILLRLDQHIAVCQSIGAITANESVAIADVFLWRRDFLTCTNPVLLHGDLGNNNMLSVDGTTIAAVIDWEDCMSGDPVFDIAFWGTFVREHMLDDFLIGYQRIAVLPDDFYARYWLYYLRIALSKTVHRHRFGYTDRSGRPPASQRIGLALERVQKTTIIQKH